MSVIDRYLSSVCCLVAVSSFTTNTSFYSTAYGLPDRSRPSCLVPVVVLRFLIICLVFFGSSDCLVKYRSRVIVGDYCEFVLVINHCCS